MGDVDGSLRNLRRRVPELRAGAECEPGYSCRRLCSRMSAAARAVDLRHHTAAGKDSEGTGYDQEGAEPVLISFEISCEGFRRSHDAETGPVSALCQPPMAAQI